MLPVFGAVLMVLPLMWPRDTAGQSLTSSGMLYLFGLWFLLCLAAFVLGRMLRYSTTDDGRDAEGMDGR